VLAALNRAFKMENQNFLYFTIWYGVYRRATRQLAVASGGHPSALLITPAQAEAPVITSLGTKGPAIGCFETAAFSAVVQSVAEGARSCCSAMAFMRFSNRMKRWELTRSSCRT